MPRLEKEKKNRSISLNHTQEGAEDKFTWTWNISPTCGTKFIQYFKGVARKIYKQMQFCFC